MKKNNKGEVVVVLRIKAQKIQGKSGIAPTPAIRFGNKLVYPAGMKPKSYKEMGVDVAGNPTAYEKKYKQKLDIWKKSLIWHEIPMLQQISGKMVNIAGQVVTHLKQGTIEIKDKEGFQEYVKGLTAKK